MYLTTIAVYGVIVSLLGGLIVFIPFYFWRLHNHSELGHPLPLKSPHRIEEGSRKDAEPKINWPVWIETPDGRVAGEVRHFNLGGAFVCCKKPLSLGKVFRMDIMGLDNDPAITTAEVVWSNIHVPYEKVINRGMGVRFIKMSDSHIRLVRQINLSEG
jgi:hypothetical protein